MNKLTTEELITTLSYTLDATRIQLILTARLLSESEIPHVAEAYRDMINACTFQAGVAQLALTRAKEAGYVA